MSVTVQDVMTAKVIWVEKDTPFAALAAALRQYRVSAFPVVDADGRVIGVVSESDMLAKEALGCGEDQPPGMITGLLRHELLMKARATTAAGLMTSPAVTVAPRDTVEQAAKLMYLHHVKRLPVVDPAGHLLGIVSRSDVLSVYGRPDEDIRDQIENTILAAESAGESGSEPAGEPAAGRGSFEVTVKDGVVTLAGRPRTGARGHEIVREIRHVEGVVSVRDLLRYPEPGPETVSVLAGFPPA